MNKHKSMLLNPALFFGVGLFPLVVVCTDFKSAILYAGILLLVMFLSQLLVGAFRLVIANRVRLVCYALSVLAVIYFVDSAIYELFPKSYSSVHGLIVFLFASSVIFYALETTKDEKTFGAGLKKTLIMGAEYSLIMVIIGFVRELVGFGSIWGTRLGDFRGINFFNGLAGGLLIVLITALIYNTVATIILKRVKVYNSLVERYGAVLDVNAKKPELNEATEDVNKSEEKSEPKALETIEEVE